MVIDCCRLGGVFLDLGIGFLILVAADFSDTAPGGTLFISGVDRAVGSGLDVKPEGTVWVDFGWVDSI